jgi:hypothetical protein
MAKGKFLGGVAIDRMRGNTASPPRAMGAAILVGASAAAITYRLLRHGSDE